MIYKLLLILIMHSLGDIILQGIKMDKMKNKHFNWLLAHVGVYSVVVLVFCYIVLDMTILQSFLFTGITAVLHLLVDLITGRARVSAWVAQNQKRYFTLVVSDQMFHLMGLFLTYHFIVEPISA